MRPRHLVPSLVFVLFGIADPGPLGASAPPDPVPSQCLQSLFGSFALKSLATDLADPTTTYLGVQDGGEYTLRADRSGITDRRSQLFGAAMSTQNPEQGFVFTQQLHTWRRHGIPSSDEIGYNVIPFHKTHNFAQKQELRAQAKDPAYVFFKNQDPADCSFEIWAFKSGGREAANKNDEFLRFTVEDDKHHPVSTREDQPANRRFQLLFRYLDRRMAGSLVRGDVALFAGPGFEGPVFVLNTGSGPRLDKFLDLENNAEGLELGPQTGARLCRGRQGDEGCVFLSTAVADFGAAVDPQIRALANAVSKVEVFSDLRAFTALAKGCIGCDFSGLDLRRHDFSGFDFTGASFVGATLDATTNLSRAVLDRADLSQLDLSQVKLDGVTRLREAKLDGANLGHLSFAEADLHGASLVGAKIEDADFREAILTSVDFSHADLGRAHFKNQTDFGRDPDRPSRFVGATVPYAAFGKDWSFRDLTGATVTGIPADLGGLDARGSVFSPGWSFPGKKLAKARFDGAVLPGVDFSGADLAFASFKGAQLRSAHFARACLAGADFTQAWLNQRFDADPEDPNRLEAANLGQAILVDAVLDGVQADGVSFEDVVMVRWGGYRSDGGTARDASFNAAKWSHAALVGMDLTGASFNGSSLSKADMVGAVARGASFQKSPYGDGSLTSLLGADLRGADLSDANLDGATLQGAELSTAEGSYSRSFAVCPGEPEIAIEDSFGPTRLGLTTANTICPDGHAGPCLVE